MTEETPNLIRSIQFLQNKYMSYKKEKNSLGMLLTMWDIGDYLKRNGITRPHSLGWKIEKEKAYISRPMIFRSFVVRRIWTSKDDMKNQLYNVKSVNSVIELFPFLDQNNKWKLPKEKLVYLLDTLNNKSSNEFNKILYFGLLLYIAGWLNHSLQLVLWASSLASASGSSAAGWVPSCSSSSSKSSASCPGSSRSELRPTRRILARSSSSSRLFSSTAAKSMTLL